MQHVQCDTAEVGERAAPVVRRILDQEPARKRRGGGLGRGQRFDRERRKQRRVAVSGPQARRFSSDGVSGLGFAATARLDLDVCPQVERPAGPGGGFICGYTLTRESATEPAAGVEGEQFGDAGGRHRAAPRGGAVQGLVMHENGHTLCTELHVELGSGVSEPSRPAANRPACSRGRARRRRGGPASGGRPTIRSDGRSRCPPLDLRGVAHIREAGRMPV